MFAYGNLTAFVPSQNPLDGPEDDAALVAIKTAPLGLHGDTPLRTSAGTRRLRDIAAGDAILTAQGDAVVVRAVRTQTFSYQDLCADRRVAPIRIDPDACDAYRGETALLLSPDLPLCVGPARDMILRADQLADGGHIRTVLPEEGVTYYSLELDAPQTVDLNGLHIYMDAASLEMSATPSACASALRDDRRVFRPAI